MSKFSTAKGAFLPLLVGAFFAGIFIHLFNIEKQTKFDELAMGKFTSSHFAVYNGYKIHGEFFEELKAWKNGIGQRAFKKRVIWLRNTIFNITPQTKRQLITGVYQYNIDSLKAILDCAKRQNLSVLVYIVPIRNDVELPYVQSQYTKFKNEIDRITKERDGKFVNLEDLVPNQFWGTKEVTGLKTGGELDFMHFQAQGHSLMAEKLGELLMEHVFARGNGH